VSQWRFVHMASEEIVSQWRLVYQVSVMKVGISDGLYERFKSVAECLREV
jgi:hypothetical protein